MKPTACRTCGQPIHATTDDVGIAVAIDPAALTPTGECLAVLSGRATFEQVAATKRYGAETWIRTSFAIGTDARHGTLHAAHVCGHPIPAAWAAPIPDHIAITHQPHNPEEPPF